MALITLTRTMTDRGVDWKNIVAYLKNVRDVVNALRGAYQDGLLSIATLANGTTAADFKTTTTTYYRVGGIQYSKAATDNIVFTAAHPVTASKYGAILIQANAAGTVGTLISGATQTTTQAYASAAAAIAALPAPSAGNVALGYVVIAAGGGGFTANTTSLSGITTYTDGTPLTAFVAGTYGALTLNKG